MKLCSACRRHIRPGDGTCPFCGELLRTTGPATLGALVLVGALGAACTDRPIEDSATGASTGSSSGTTAGTTSTSTSSTSSTTGTPTTTSATSSTTSSGTTAVSSTGELSTSNDVDSNDPGCNFYGGACFDFLDDPFQCDVWAQNCPPGEKCMPYDGDFDNSWDSLKCVPVAQNPGQHDEPCTAEGSGVSGLDSCDVGHMCWEVDPDTLEGTCVKFCTGSPNEPMCTVPDTECMMLDQSGVLNLCLPVSCDPIIQDCDLGESCLPTPGKPEHFQCFPDGSGDEGQEFGKCAMHDGCDPGLLCAPIFDAEECDPLSFGCCLAFCDLTDPKCNGQDSACVPFFDVPPPGLAHVGLCE